MILQNWGDALTQSLLNVWGGVANFVPDLLLAIIIFAIGWVLAALVEKLVESIFKSLKIDALLKSAGTEDVVKRAGYSLNSGLFVGVLCKWFVIVVFLMAAFDSLHLQAVTGFLVSIVNYLPNVIVAVLVLMVAVVLANAMQKIVTASSRAAHVNSSELLGRITKWAIWIFAILTALFNLGVAPALIQTIIMDVFAGGALAFGLDFGLGGKTTAEKIVEKTLNNISE